jgi:glycosyltransferase involved in cell wall biosynthesis
MGDRLRPWETKPISRALRLALTSIGDPRRGIQRSLGHEDFNFPGARKLLDLTAARPDLIHCHNLHGGYFDLRALAWLSQRMPVLITLHDNWMLSGHCAYSLACERWASGCGSCPDLTLYPSVMRDATARNWKVKQALYRRSRLHIATPSRWLMDMVQRSMLMEGAVECRVVPYGVDLSLFRPGDQAESRRLLGLDPEARTVLFTANKPKSNMWKDYGTLEAAIAQAASRMPGRLICLALGESAPPAMLGRAEIRFLSYEKDRSRVAHFYRAADLYIHPARADNFPLTVLEALACGKPVVATSVGGIPEQVRHAKTGFLVPLGDPAAMAAATVKILSDPVLMKNMAEEATADARIRFDSRAQATLYRNWYLEILESNSIRRPE